MTAACVRFPLIFLLTAILGSTLAEETVAQSATHNSSSQVTDCSIWLPGDGTGVTVAQANAHNAAAEAAKQSGVCNGTAAFPGRFPNTYSPKALGGSAYMNALQGYLSAMVSRFTPSTGRSDTGTADPTLELFHPSPLIDPDAFARAGKDSISRDMDSLLNHCPEAVQYVESKDGLVGEFDKVFTQYKIRKDAAASIQKIKDELLSDTWWARSSGPDVAREVKFLADGLTDIFGMLSPEGEVVNSIKQIEDVTPSSEFGYDNVVEYRESVDNIKATYEHNENVDDAATRAAIQLSEKFLKNSRFARVVPFVDFAQHLQERAQTAKEGFKFKVEVEYQVRRLDEQITQFNNQMDNYRHALEAMNAIHDTVIGVCVPKSIPIDNSAKD